MPMKNRELIAINLEEAIEQLQEIVSELRQNSDFEEVELKINLEHAYHHVNFVWHIRKASEEEVAECSESNYIKWSKFPVGEINEYD